MMKLFIETENTTIEIEKEYMFLENTGESNAPTRVFMKRSFQIPVLIAVAPSDAIVTLLEIKEGEQD